VIQFFVIHSLIESAVAIPRICLFESLWSMLRCIHCLRSWNGYYYPTWIFIDLVCLSSNLSTHWYLVYSLIIFRLTPSFWWFNLLSKLISYGSCFWHYRSHLLFMWNNNGYLKYPIHQPGPFWWWCELFGHHCLQLYNKIICTFYGIKFGFIENGSAILTLGGLHILNFFCTNYFYLNQFPTTCFLNCCGPILSFVVVL
jgi:hypothetical protein